MYSMIRNKQTKIADKRIQCNASLFVQGAIEDPSFVQDLDEQDKENIEKAKANGWDILPGQEYVYYEYTEQENPTPNAEWIECCEIPEMRQICNDFDLYG